MESLLLASALLAGLPEAAVTPYDLVLAHARLRMPPGQVEDFSWPLRDGRAMVQAAGAAGLLGRDEATYRNVPEYLLQEQLDAWREQLLELRDCPEEWEGAWLPTPERCQELFVFYGHWENHVREYVYWHRDREDWGDVLLGEGAARLRLWRAVDWCRYAPTSSHTRRTKMREVRNMIGREAWDRRELPFVAPEWAFVERR